MKILRIMVGVLLANVAFISASSASDFDWMDSLSVMAKADSSGFRLRLSTRFHIGDAQIKTVIGNVGSDSDAYMIFRLGELSHRPINEVLDVYHAHRKNGWGVMAKHLGIKPGSREFHALKRGHDMDDGHGRGSDRERGEDHPSGKHHGMGSGQGKGNR